MALGKTITTKIAIPQGVTVTAAAGKVATNGPKGKNARTLLLKNVEIKVAGKEVEVTGPMREANTTLAHVANMLKGSHEGFSQKMKVIYAHFPIAMEVKGKEIIIKNFVGEKQPRKAPIIGETKVEIKMPMLTVSGPSRDDVGQTVANLRTASKIKNRDSRIFQDGVYPVEE